MSDNRHAPRPADVARLLTAFTGSDLTAKLSKIEGSIKGITADNCGMFLETEGAGREALAAAADMKKLAGQINVTIHALGILLCLPHILEPGEQIEYVSLGAGNTGRAFDLETDRRVAEFKFIRWRGGAESIRQNSIFKDLFFLNHHQTDKRKYLYLLGTSHAIKFLKGGRSLNSILSRHEKLNRLFHKQYGAQFVRVSEWYAMHRDGVKIEDVTPWLSELAEGLIEDEVGPESA